MRWNLRKTYLRDLDAAGVPVVPTRWADGLTAGDLAGAFDQWGTAEVVAKPVVSANADGTFRLGPDPDTWAPALSALAGRPCLVQPFVPDVVARGEWSVFAFGGAVSHAILKTPAPGDFRVQEEHGGVIRGVEPHADLLALADAALAAVPWPRAAALRPRRRGPDARRRARGDGAGADRAVAVLPVRRRVGRALRGGAGGPRVARPGPSASGPSASGPSASGRPRGGRGPVPRSACRRRPTARRRPGPVRRCGVPAGHPDPTMQPPPTPADSTPAEMDAALADLAAHATEWARRPLADKIEMLEGLRPRIADVAGRWVTAASRAKGLAVGSPLRGEEWTSGPWVLANYIGPLVETLRHVERGTLAQAVAGHVRQRPDGQTVVRVLPDGLYDRVLLAGIEADVWQAAGRHARVAARHHGDVLPGG